MSHIGLRHELRRTVCIIVLGIFERCSALIRERALDLSSEAYYLCSAYRTMSLPTSFLALYVNLFSLIGFILFIARVLNRVVAVVLLRN